MSSSSPYQRILLKLSGESFAAPGQRGLRDGLRSGGGVETASFLIRLNETIRHNIAYLRREEPGVQPPAETLRLMHGSCRDVAVLMCEAARSQGFASSLRSAMAELT